jgi:ABC-type glycerol-3-phosphate transport system permease component
MSHELVICLIAVAVNLAGMVAIYCAMSHVIARQVWRRHGVFGVIALILIAQLFWIAPAFWIEAQGADRAGSYALWLGNWLVCGFSLVLFLKSTARIPVALHDAARIDGLSGLATWRHATLPFVRRDLVIVAVFTVMATLLPFWGVINTPDSNVVTLFERTSTFAQHFTRMAAGSLLGAIPLIAIFFAAKRAA